MDDNFDFAKVANDIGANLRQAYYTGKYAAEVVVDWCSKNPEKVAIIAGGTIAIIKLARTLSVNKRVAAENFRIAHTYYSPSTGFHWDLKRAATNADRIQILNLKGKGYAEDAILKMLNLI